MKSIEELGISPTPWRVLEWSGLSSQYTIESETHTVCDLDNDDSVEPDARLMAAAPELYEALRLACGTCIDCCEDCSDCINFNRSWMPAARAALKKAGGAE